jgi:hypothetical protein
MMTKTNLMNVRNAMDYIAYRAGEGDKEVRHGIEMVLEYMYAKDSDWAIDVSRNVAEKILHEIGELFSDEGSISLSIDDLGGYDQAVRVLAFLSSPRAYIFAMVYLSDRIRLMEMLLCRIEQRERVDDQYIDQHEIELRHCEDILFSRMQMAVQADFLWQLFSGDAISEIEELMSTLMR